MGRRKISDTAPSCQLEKEEEGLKVQLISAFVINLVALQQGASVSSSSVILHSLQEELGCFNSTTGSPLLLFDFYLDLGFDFSINAEEGSWVASAWVLSHLLAAPIAGFVTDKIGRRKALMIDTVLFFVGFLILTVANSLPWLILARLLLGCPLVSQVLNNVTLDQNQSAKDNLFSNLIFLLPLPGVPLRGCIPFEARPCRCYVCSPSLFWLLHDAAAWSCVALAGGHGRARDPHPPHHGRPCQPQGVARLAAKTREEPRSTGSSRLLQNLTASVCAHIERIIIPRCKGEEFVGAVERHLAHPHPAGFRLLVQLCLPGFPLPPPRLVRLLNPLILRC